MSKQIRLWDSTREESEGRHGVSGVEVSVISFSHLLLRRPFSRRLFNENNNVRYSRLAWTAQHTLSLLLAHDGRGILLELLELGPRHVVFCFLFIGQPLYRSSGVFHGSISRDEPATPPSSGPWPGRCRAGYPVSWRIKIWTAIGRDRSRAGAGDGYRGKWEEVREEREKKKSEERGLHRRREGQKRASRTGIGRRIIVRGRAMESRVGSIEVDDRWFTLRTGDCIKIKFRHLKCH